MTHRGLSNEEIAIDEMAVDFFHRRAPLDGQHQRSRAVVFEGARPEAHFSLTTEMAELGFFAQAAPEAHGGLAMRPVVSSLICTAAGRELVPGTWMDQLCAVRVAEPLGAAVSAEIHEARRSVAIAVSDLPLRRRGRKVSAVLSRVNFADQVDSVIIVGPDAVQLIDLRSEGVVVSAETPDVDPLCAVHRVELTDVEPVAESRIDADHAAAMIDHIGVLVAAFSVGAAQRVLDIAVEYVKNRQQFGRAIGSFQAVKHRAATCQIELVHARAAMRRAAFTGSGSAVARYSADRCLRMISESALQMHGGIGFTAEVPIHLFLRTAQRLRVWPRSAELAFDDVRRELRLDGAITAGGVRG